MQNLLTVVNIEIPHNPSGSDPDDSACLLHSVAITAAACRAAILQLRRPAAILAEYVKWSMMPYQLESQPAPVPDILVSNWNGCAACFETHRDAHAGELGKIE